MHKFKGVFVGQSAHHASLEVIVIDHLLGSDDAFDASVNLETEGGEVCLQTIDPVVYQWRN